MAIITIKNARITTRNGLIFTITICCGCFRTTHGTGKICLLRGFLRDIKPELRRLVARWTGEYQYTINKVLDDIIRRCRELKLRLSKSTELTTLESIVLVTVQTMNYLHDGHHRLAL